MYKKKKEKKISSKFRRNLKSNLRKKISLQGSSILPASSMDYRANRSAKQCTWSLKKKKKVQEPFESGTSECHFQFWRLDTYPGYI